MYRAAIPSARVLIKPGLLTLALSAALGYFVSPLALAAVALCLWVGFVAWWTRFIGGYVGQMMPSHVTLKHPSVISQNLTGIKVVFAELKSLARVRQLCLIAPHFFLRSLHLFTTYSATCSTEWPAPYRWGRVFLTVALFTIGLAWSWFFPLVLYVSMAPLLARYCAVLRKLENDYPRTEWEHEVDARPPDHLFLGRLVHTGQPLVLHTKLLSENVVFFGPPGSRKSTEMLSLALQLLAEDQPPAIFWITGKLDLATFNALRQAAGTFNMFTLARHKSSLSLDSLASLRLLFEAVPFDLTDAILSAVGAFYGEGYGRSYFHGRGRKLLFQILNRAENAGRFPANFADLVELIEKAPADDRRDADEMAMIVSALSHHPRLNPSPDAPRLNIEQAILNHEVTHFDFPAAVSPVQSHETAGMVLYEIFHTTRRLYDQGTKARVVVFIDEAQNFVTTSNVATLLAEGRQFGCSFVMACQSESQLKTPDGRDFKEEVKDLVRARVHLAVTNSKLAQELMLLSGEKIETLMSEGESITTKDSDEESIGRIISIRQYRRTCLEPNDLVLLNCDRLVSLIIVQDHGETKTGAVPTLYRGSWPIDPPELYTWLESQPWPRAEEVSPPAPLPKKKKEKWLDL